MPASRLALFCCLLPAATATAAGAGASPAVQALNYELDVGTAESESLDLVKTDSQMFAGRLSMPLSNRLGGFFSVTRSRSEMRAMGERCDAELDGYGGGLLVRDPSLGRLGLGYSRGEAQACSFGAAGATASKTDVESYDLQVAYYSGSLTLGLQRTRDEYDGGDTVDTAFAHLTWYPSGNLAIHAAAGWMDADDERSLRLEYQPDWFGNAASVWFGHRTGGDVDTLTAGITYYFGTRVDLATRDRHFR